MDVGDFATLAGACALLAFATWVLTERRRSRKLLGLLHGETQGLCREAADLAEAICRRQADGAPIDPPLLLRYALTEPQTWPGLASSTWRLPADLAGRAVDFHGHLCLARTRLADWRSGERDRLSTYLLVSALVRSANAGDGLLWGSTRGLGRQKNWKPETPLASAFLEEMEREDMELLDFG